MNDMSHLSRCRDSAGSSRRCSGSDGFLSRRCASAAASLASRRVVALSQRLEWILFGPLRFRGGLDGFRLGHCVSAAARMDFVRAIAFPRRLGWILFEPLRFRGGSDGFRLGHCVSAAASPVSARRIPIRGRMPDAGKGHCPEEVSPEAFLHTNRFTAKYISLCSDASASSLPLRPSSL